VAGHVWAYARVSTRDQNPQLQLDVLEASGYDTLVQEKESGKRGVLRPAWQELLPLPQPGDTLKFWKSDRWGRSAADVLATVNELRDRGVTVVSLTENFDLGHQGRPAHVRRAGPGRRVRARAARRAPGRRDRRRPPPPGRGPDAARQEAHRPPPATGPAELAALRDLIAGGKSVTEAARILKIGRSTAYAALAAA
jgi:DNA invertase Pin-like site-specific DNA recombinase